MTCSFHLTDDSSGKLLKCPDYFDISISSELHDCLQQLINEKPSRLILDSANLEVIDTAILQTLYAFMRIAGQAGIEVSWRNTNETLLQAARYLGMSEILQLEQIRAPGVSDVN